MKPNELKLRDAEAEQINNILKRHGRFRRWQRTVSVLAVLVLALSGYAMMRPAVTMDRDSVFGQNLNSPEGDAPARDPVAAGDASESRVQADGGAVSVPAAKGKSLFAAGAPVDQSRFVDRLDIKKPPAVSGDEFTLTIGFGGTNKDWVSAGDYIIVTWPETGTARLVCTLSPDTVTFKKTETVIATTVREPGRLTITFNEAAEDVTGIKRWGTLDLNFTAFVDREHPDPSATLTIAGGSFSNSVTVEKKPDYYTIYDALGGNFRKVLDPQGNLDAEWSLCLNHNKASPGSDTAAGGEYIRIANPTEEQYMEFSGDTVPGNFQKVKRILYARAALYPEYSYYVFQDELYYVITGMTKYDTNWGSADLNAQKLQIREVENSDRYDAEIAERLEVVIYQEHKAKFQNTITAFLKAPPPANTASLTVEKRVTGAGGEKDRSFNFTLYLYCPRRQGTTEVLPLPGTYEAVRNGVPETLTFDSAGKASFTLKHGESLTVNGIENGFYYKLAELEADTEGYTTTVQRPEPAGQYDPGGDINNFDTCDGVTDTVHILFTNDREAPVVYQAQVRARKTLGGGLPADRQFSFVLTDADGRELTCRNDAQGGVLFLLELPGPGTYTYTLRELNDGQEGVVYDEREYTVRVEASEPAEPGGTPGISVTCDGGPGPAEFSNRYGYVLPETGGIGIGGYTGGGTALVSVSLLSLYIIIKSARRKEGSP